MKFAFIFSLFILSQGFCFDGKVFDKKRVESIPIWAEEKLKEDFLPFENHHITESMIDSSMRNNVLRCKVINHKLYFYDQANNPCHPNESEYPRLKALYLSLKYLTKKELLPNLDFLISLEDYFDEHAEAPVLCFAKKRNCNSAICIPDFEALYGYDPLLDVIFKATKRFPFENKIEKCFWRGATSGGSYSLKNWISLPRSQLVLFSKEHPDLVDAKFTNVIQIPDEEQGLLKSILKKRDLLSKNVSISDHLAYKYLIDIDGNSCTYSRLFWILASNSVCLKQVSQHEQWYYRGIKPYVHYIPFKEDLSDFMKKLSWAQTHQDEIIKIIDQANKFVLNSLTQEDAFYYLYCVLIKYAKLLGFEPHR